MDKQNMVYLHSGVLLCCLKNDTVKFVGKGRELEKLILSDRTQIQKDKYGIYSLISEHVPGSKL